MDWVHHILRQLLKSQTYSNTVPWPLFFSHSSAVLRMNSRYLAKITADKENCYHGVVPANRSNPARKITGAPKIRQEHLSPGTTPGSLLLRGVAVRDWVVSSGYGGSASSSMITRPPGSTTHRPNVRVHGGGTAAETTRSAATFTVTAIVTVA